MVRKTLQIVRPDLFSHCPRPLFLGRVPAGFPSPAEDDIEGTLDLNRRYIRHPAATFFVRVSGESMVGAGIFPDDILIVDRSLKAADRRVVVAVMNGEMTVKRLRRKDGRLFLVSENDAFPTMEVEEGTDFQVWGVATCVIHSL